MTQCVAAKEIQATMFTALYGEIAVNTLEYKVFRTNVDAYFGSGDIARCADVLDLLRLLETRGIISLGKYDGLKKILSGADLQKAMNIVMAKEKKIREALGWDTSHEDSGDDSSIYTRANPGPSRQTRSRGAALPKRSAEEMRDTTVGGTKNKQRRQQSQEPSCAQSSDTRMKVQRRKTETLEHIDGLIKCEEAYVGPLQSKGRVLMLTNSDFGDPKRNLPGLMKEKEDIKTVLTQLGFEENNFKCKENMTAKKMKKILKKQANKLNEDVDCFVCFISSHGNTDYVSGTDCVKLTIKEITELFDGENCPLMVGKPKLFFINTCQGDQLDKGAVLQGNVALASAAIEGDKIDNTKDVPIKADILVALSTVPGYVSWAYPSGSVFTQTLLSVLKEFAHKLELQGLLIKVNASISEKKIEPGEEIVKVKGPEYRVVKQMSWISHSLRKQFYFCPALVDEDKDQA